MQANRERDELLGQLGGARRHVLRQIEGLDDTQLEWSGLPSGWSPLGLVRHLTLSDERYWFEVVVAGGSLDYWPEGENGDWVVAPTESPAAVIQAYRAAIAASDVIITERALDSPPARPEPDWATHGLAFPDLRSIVAHVLVETATHAGQLDVVRELIDGHQHLVL